MTTSDSPMDLLRSLSIPSLALGAIAVYTIAKHTANMYDPSMLMRVFGIHTRETARTVAFLLVLINGYDLLSAVQDNRAVVWFSITARVSAAGFFAGCGNPWNKLIFIELATTSVLLGALLIEVMMG